MDGPLVFRIDIVTHHVARDAKLFGVGHFQDGVEPTPENDPGNKAEAQNEAHGNCAGTLEQTPISGQDVWLAGLGVSAFLGFSCCQPFIPIQLPSVS